MFKEAAKKKLRFKVQNGLATTEDLWSLSLTSLNDIAININRELKLTEEIFIEEKSRNDELLELKFSVVKAVIEDKLTVNKATKDKVILDQRKAKLAEIIASKKDDSLNNMSIEELTKEYESL